MKQLVEDSRPVDFTPVSSKEFVDIQPTIEWGATLKCFCDMLRTYSQMYHKKTYLKHISITLLVWLNGWLNVVADRCLVAVTQTSAFTPASRKEFADIQATVECGATVKRFRHMLRTYSQMHHKDRYLKHISISFSVCLDRWLNVIADRSPVVVT